MLPLRHGDSYYIGRLLNGAYQIVYARNGAEGLEIAAEQMPDLILTDLMMPEMDGYELCRRVRESEVLNHIPIIIITAKSGGKERVCGLEVGADAYLEKPFNAEELNIRITNLRVQPLRYIRTSMRMERLMMAMNLSEILKKPKPEFMR